MQYRPRQLGFALVIASLVGCAPPPPAASEGADVAPLYAADAGEVSSTHPATILWSDGDDIYEDAWELDGEDVLVQGDISLGTQEEAWAEHTRLGDAFAAPDTREKALADTTRRSRRTP